MVDEEFYKIVEETANLKKAELRVLYEKADLAETKFQEGARQFFSRNLSGTSEEKPYICDITLEHGYVGMSSLEMPHISAMYMDNDGIIWVHIDGYDWIEIDDISIHHQMEMIKQFD